MLTLHEIPGLAVKRLGYVPALDGLRGVAILLVLADHVLGWSPGGRGVDLFFVLSGFLITTLLLEERGRHGKVSLRGFYVRRGRRLLPALFVFLAAYLAVEAVRGVNALGVVLRYGFYLGNFSEARNLSTVNYHSLTSFGLGHLWSLATEEQFYLFWPIVLLVIVRESRPLAWALGLLVFAEFFRLWLALHGTNVGILYLLPQGHSQGLILGSCVALYRFRRGFSVDNRVAASAVAFAAVAVAISGDHAYEDFFIWRLPLVEIALVIVVVAAVSETHVAKLLAVRPLVWVGLISYSLYLWHFMFVLLFNYQQPVAVLAASFACATASYCWVERPFRRTQKSPLLDLGEADEARGFCVRPGSATNHRAIARRAPTHDQVGMGASGRGEPVLERRPDRERRGKESQSPEVSRTLKQINDGVTGARSRKSGAEKGEENRSTVERVRGTRYDGRR